MAENTKIQWAHHSFNPWRGCAKVSPACDNCYAEAMAKRNPGVLGTWGENGTRPMASESYWRHPLKWNAEAEAAGENHRVFCASLADVFEDRADLREARWRLGQLILKTPHLDWLLLTKRPENWRQCFGEMWHDGEAPPNVWMGVSVEQQKTADERIPYLSRTPAALRFLSAEPLLGPIDLRGHLRYIDWVIVGGESGPGARLCRAEWIEEIVEECRYASVPVFVKQLGATPSDRGQRIHLKDRKGGDMAEWPEHLRVREWPASETGA